MKEKKIYLTKGTFVVFYDESKPWTASDENLVDKYKEFLESELMMYEKAKSLFRRYESHNQGIQFYLDTFRQINELIKEVKVASDLILNDMATKGTYDFQRWLQKVNDISDVIVNTSGSLQIIAKENETIDQLFNNLMIEKNECKLSEQYDLAKNLHHQNQLENSVESFLCDELLPDKGFDWSRELFMLCNATLQNFNGLMREIDSTYVSLADHEKRIRLIKIMIGNGFGSSDLNLN